jgi:hypothetical protein
VIEGDAGQLEVSLSIEELKLGTSRREHYRWSASSSSLNINHLLESHY